MAVAEQVESLNRVRYGGLDFDTHFDDLRARAQVEFAADFNDFALSSLGIMLIDLVAYGLDSLSFYLDRRASDSYLDTARTTKAVARLSRQLGYKMGAAVSSSVDIQVAINSPAGFNFPVPILKGFQFKGPQNLIYETAQAVTFDPFDGPTDPQTIPCYEGQTVTENFVSDGTANQSFALRRVPSNTFVVQGAVQVFVNGGTWTESDFISFDPTNQFEVGYNDDPPTIHFGDGTAGNIPAVSAPIVVQYVAAQGKAGQISSGAINDVVTPLVASFTTIPLTVTNIDLPEGGDDPEAIAKVKVLAGRVFKSRQVAITRGDYQALSNAFADPLYGRVAAAQAISARSAANDTFLQNAIDDIKGLVAPIKNAVNDLTKFTSTALSGDVGFVSTSTAVTGTNTKFITEVKVGQYIKKTSDVETLYAKVQSIFSNDALTLETAYGGTSGAEAAVLNGPTGIALLGALRDLTDIQTQLKAVGTAATDANNKAAAALTETRNSKLSAIEIYNDAAEIISEAANGALDLTSPSTAIATANLAIGVGGSRIAYFAKVPGAVGAGVRVAHIAGGSLAVAVVNLDITVTVSPATTATQAAAAVAADGTASTLVDAYAFGAGTGNPPLIGLTNLGYSGVNSLAASGIPDTLQSTLQTRFDRCKTGAVNIQTNASSLQTSMDTASTAVVTIEEDLDNIGLDILTSGSLLFAAEQSRLAVVGLIGSTAPTGLYKTLADIDTQVVPLDTTGLVTNTVGERLGGQGLPVPAEGSIYNHVDVLLADDCKSNHVSVPILTHDAAGFYTEPSLGLQQALQSYLDVRKEVTQTVSVTSGGTNLIRPVIRIRLGVTLGYAVSVTKAAVASAVDGILKDRAFGASLYLSDFDIIKTKLVAGIAFMNVTLAGYNNEDKVFGTDKLDANGNLIVKSTEVITKEQRALPVAQAGVTITTEIVTPQ